MCLETGNESKAESLRQDFPKLLQDQPQCQGAEFFNNSDLFSHLDLQNYSYPRIILCQGKQLAQDATSLSKISNFNQIQYYWEWKGELYLYCNAKCKLTLQRSLQFIFWRRFTHTKKAFNTEKAKYGVNYKTYS